MTYRNPFLSRLSDAEEQRRYELSRQDKQTAANDRRYAEASELLQKAPITLNDMINEERDRKEKVRQFDVNKSQADRAHGFQVRKYEEDQKSEKLKLENARARELASNAAKAMMFVPEASKPLPPMPVQSTGAEIPAVKPMSLKDLKESASLHGDLRMPPEISSMSMSVRGPAGSAPVKPGPLVGQTPGHAHIAEVGLPKQETLLEQSKQGDREMARAIMAKYPQIAQHLTEDDVAAKIAENRIMMDATAHKQAVDHDKLELQRMQIASREQMAQMQMKLKERIAAQKKAKSPKEFAVTGEQNKQLIGAMNNLQAISTIEDMLASNETGFLKGVERKIRETTKFVNEDDASFQSRVQMVVNDEIKRLAGSAVSESEAGRVLSAMPDIFLNPAAFKARLGALKDQNKRMWDNTLTLAEINSLNRESQVAPEVLRNKFNSNTQQQNQNVGLEKLKNLLSGD